MTFLFEGFILCNLHWTHIWTNTLVEESLGENMLKFHVKNLKFLLLTKATFIWSKNAEKRQNI